MISNNILLKQIQLNQYYNKKDQSSRNNWHPKESRCTSKQNTLQGQEFLKLKYIQGSQLHPHHRLDNVLDLLSKKSSSICKNKQEIEMIKKDKIYINAEEQIDSLNRMINQDLEHHHTNYDNILSMRTNSIGKM